MTEKQCAETVWRSLSNGSYFSDCEKRAKYEEDGKWWCGTHAPSKVAARRAKKRAEDEAESAAKNATERAARAAVEAYQAAVGVEFRISFYYRTYGGGGYDFDTVLVPLEVLKQLTERAQGIER